MSINSDDLILVLALCQEQTLEKAGRALNKDPSSIFRAIKRIEQKIAQPLFIRSHKGYTPLALAEEFSKSARTVNDELLRVNNGIFANQSDFSGSLRITTADILLRDYIRPHLLKFFETYPDITLHFDTESTFTKLWERNVDIAVRPSSSPPDQMIGHYLSKTGYGAMCSPKYKMMLDTRKSTLKAARWLIPGGKISTHQTVQWFKSNVEHEGAIITYDSFLQLVDAAKAGIGIALVPLLPQTVQGLVSISDFRPNCESEIWALYHPSNKQIPRIRAFVNFLKKMAPE